MRNHRLRLPAGRAGDIGTLFRHDFVHPLTLASNAANYPELSGLEHLESLEMTLARGHFVTFDYNRMVVLFTMMDGETDVPCAISTTAMDDLDKTREAKTPEQREAQFLRLRDQIESRAARKFLDVGREGNPPGLILRSLDFAS